jgi:hypothetical protein
VDALRMTVATTGEVMERSWVVPGSPDLGTARLP